MLCLDVLGKRNWNYYLCEWVAFLSFNNNNFGKNLGRLFSRCVSDLHLDEQNMSSVIQTSTELPSMSNLIRFFPMLLELKVLEKDTVAKVNLILKQVYQVRS